MKKRILALILALICVFTFSSCRKKTPIRVVVYDTNDNLLELFPDLKIRKDAEAIDTYYYLERMFNKDTSILAYISVDRIKGAKEIYRTGEDDHRYFQIIRNADLPAGTMTGDFFLFVCGTKGQEILKSNGYSQIIEKPVGFCASCYKPSDPEGVTIRTDEKSLHLVEQMVKVYSGYNKEARFNIVTEKAPMDLYPSGDEIVFYYGEPVEIEGAKLASYADNGEIGFIVSDENHLVSMDKETLRKILSGKIRYWEDIN